jgi:elongation factor P
MLEYNEILKGKVILLDGEPYEVLDAHVFRKQQRKPVNQTKLRHLITGKVTEQAFHVSEKMPEADLSTKNVKFLYNNRSEWWFSDEKNQSDRFKLEESTVGTQGKFLKANTVVEALIFDDPKISDGAGKIIGLKLPIKVDLKVTEAMPAVKGNTAQGGSKQVTLETGTTLFVPMFINEGDVIRINTELGEYVERADKN